MEKVLPLSLDVDVWTEVHVLELLAMSLISFSECLQECH